MTVRGSAGDSQSDASARAVMSQRSSGGPLFASPERSGYGGGVKPDLEGPRMAAPLKSHASVPEQRLALEMLDRSHGVCTRSIWAVHGFTLALLIGLVTDGLADVQAETVSGGGRTIEIVRIRITAAGRDALDES